MSGSVRIRQPHGHTVAVHRAVALRSGGTLLTTAGVAAVTVRPRDAASKTARVSHGDSRRHPERGTARRRSRSRRSAAPANAITDRQATRDRHAVGPRSPRPVHLARRLRLRCGARHVVDDHRHLRFDDDPRARGQGARHRLRHATARARVRRTQLHRAQATSGRGGSAPRCPGPRRQPIGNGGALISISCPTTYVLRRGRLQRRRADERPIRPAAPSTWTTTPVGTSSLGFDAISCPIDDALRRQRAAHRRRVGVHRPDRRRRHVDRDERRDPRTAARLSRP